METRATKATQKIEIKYTDLMAHVNHSLSIKAENVQDMIDFGIFCLKCNQHIGNQICFALVEF